VKYQETGRFGRITKSLRRNGFENKMDKILSDSSNLSTLKNKEQTKYVETVLSRMEEEIGTENTKQVMFECGAKCCGKSWVKFAQTIFNNSNSVENFFDKLNKEEKKYNTYISFNEDENNIEVKRTKCICGLINKGEIFSNNSLFCFCSNGHMWKFFHSIFSVDKISFEQSIFSGADVCSWKIKLKNNNPGEMI
jgi:hypothetical protein